MPSQTRIDRRQFAGSLAIGSSAVAALITSPLNSADDDRPNAEPKAKDEAKPDETPERPAKPSLEVLLLTYLTQRYPSDQFDEAALQGIYGDLRGDVARGRILSGYPLNNSDEPAFVFQVYREGERGVSAP